MLGMDKLKKLLEIPFVVVESGYDDPKSISEFVQNLLKVV